jgi:hypothetical protein
MGSASTAASDERVPGAASTVSSPLRSSYSIGRPTLAAIIAANAGRKRLERRRLALTRS